jgi:hypothetical protein
MSAPTGNFEVITMFLSRKEASLYLKAKGLPVAASTLAKYFTIGGGPKVQHFGRKPLYDETELDEWAKKKLTAPRGSSSERTVAQEQERGPTKTAKKCT